MDSMSKKSLDSLSKNSMDITLLGIWLAYLRYSRDSVRQGQTHYSLALGLRNPEVIYTLSVAVLLAR